MSYAKPYTQLYCHLRWATYERLPLITPAVEARLYGAVRAGVCELRCEPLAVGGIEDHIHLLCRLDPAVSVAPLVQKVKGATSHLVTHEIGERESFRWQQGYAAYTIPRDAVPAARDYVLRQKQHHANSSLWPERETDQPAD